MTLRERRVGAVGAVVFSTGTLSPVNTASLVERVALSSARRRRRRRRPRAPGHRRARSRRPESMTLRPSRMHACAGRRHRAQRQKGTLGAMLLKEADDGVDDHNRADGDGIEQFAERRGQRGRARSSQMTGLAN